MPVVPASPPKINTKSPFDVIADKLSQRYQLYMCISYCHDLLIVLLLVFFEESVVHEFLDGRPFVGILLETLIQEVPDLSRHAQIGGDLDFVLHYLYQLLLSGYLERILTHHHLVHHYADRPNVDLLVVFPSLQDLRTHVQRSTAESGTQFVVLVH